MRVVQNLQPPVVTRLRASLGMSGRSIITPQRSVKVNAFVFRKSIIF